MRWFDLREKDLIFESVLIWFITTVFDLQLRNSICDLSKSQTELQ